MARRDGRAAVHAGIGEADAFGWFGHLGAASFDFFGLLGVVAAGLLVGEQSRDFSPFSPLAINLTGCSPLPAGILLFRAKVFARSRHSRGGTLARPGVGIDPLFRRRFFGDSTCATLMHMHRAKTAMRQGETALSDQTSSAAQWL
jgi:hypothetical protein